ncbi:DUF4236 domain-containing protein [uncultured Bradyrhizobium sp.]|jgi:hypothetical protein|uniref:DUF4236 domain-containing protein n=1 Tax=uncultured Bradyrhizobium sp. TaxID=199684 RepID=UPI0026188CA1|nr:DUF4236 domain-containing protein [uncultured Bradyrhizobium sp.]
MRDHFWPKNIDDLGQDWPSFVISLQPTSHFNELRMGFFRFRRTFRIAPGLRLNLSKSGASVSFGPRGLHYTVGSKGARTTVGIPGSGISWTSYQPYSSGHEHPTEEDDWQGTDNPVTSDQNAATIESAPIEQLVANSTMEIAQALNANRSRWQSRKVLLTILAIAFAVAITATANAAGNTSPNGVFLMILGASIIWIATAFYSRQSLILSLQYDLSDKELEPFNRLARAFNTMARCRYIWQIPLERSQPDWKRNAGASTSVERTRISLTSGRPPLVKSNIDFLSLQLSKEGIYFTPDAILVFAKNSVAALQYDDLEIVCRRIRFIENERPPSDAQVVGSSWLYVNKDGGPDRRFNNNRKLPICLYPEIDLKSGGGLDCRINCSGPDGAEEFVTSIIAMRSNGAPAQSDLLPTSAKPPPLRLEPIRAPGSSSVIAAYETESKEARTLALEHGHLWEFLLVKELLRSKLRALKTECDQFDELLKSTPKRRFGGSDFVDWVANETAELSDTVAKFTACIEKDLIVSLGEPGVSGDAVKILSTVNAIFGHCRRFLIFELLVCAADVPSALRRLQFSFRGITLSVISVVEELDLQWTKNVEALRNGSHEFKIKVTFSAPPQFQKVSEEIERLKRNPGLLQ